MVNLTIRNIPEEILKRIRIFASKERRSLNSELLIVIEEGVAGRIAGETGGVLYSGNLPGTASSLSSAGREKIWQELCGEWRDEKNLQQAIDEIYSLRDGNSSRGERI
jgi:hypothetical protein